ncbi:tyrosine-type recombinase/integrase [Nocardia otitidiscaviarum]|uniref:tyrosine-type recombinase/integrase n=1 Tax=Nocardia otitidiscaviarum TaxID=1823 RepID=UPI0007C7B874|nr:tyrosine-type recombinase/integrase [Nocardia otitidiscaviarum]
MRAEGFATRTIDDRIAAVEQFAAATGVDPTHADTDAIVEWLATSHWQTSSRNTRHTQLKAWFVWLHKHGHRDDNPMADLPAPKRGRGRPRPFTVEELRRIEAAPMHHRTRAMLRLALCQGFRVHEIAKARGEDFDLVSRSITVTGKGGKTATLPMHPLVHDIALSMPRTGWWFPSNATRPGRHVRPGSVSDVIRKLCMRAGIKGWAHRLRHSFATGLLDHGVDVRVVQELMRHESLATTQIYTLVSDARRIDALERYNPYASSTEGARRERARDRPRSPGQGKKTRPA